MQKQNTTFPANPVYYNDIDQSIWSYISFGSYPQAEVTGEALTPQMIGSLYDSDGNAWIDDTKYRRISRNDTTDSEFFGKHEGFRYFKWEKIRWKVLQNDGKTLFVMADTALDSRAFNIGYNRSVTWEHGCTQINGTGKVTENTGIIVIGGCATPAYVQKKEQLSRNLEKSLTSTTVCTIYKPQSCQ